MEKFDRRLFGTLFFSMFVTVTGVGIVVPLLPVYAHHLGAGGFFIGLIFGAFSISRTAFLPVFGMLSDRNGRKPYIVMGLFFYTLISFAFIISHTITALIVIRFVQGIASAMIMPVVHAYVGDITPPNKEGRIMGIFNVSVFTGLSLGPLAGGFINEHFSLETAFLFMGILCCCGFLLSLFFLPPEEKKHRSRKTAPSASYMSLIKDPEIFGLFSYRFAYTACIAVIWGFLPVYADAAFSLSSSRIGILVTLGVFVSGAIQPVMGYLADRFSKRGMVITGGLIAAAAVLSFPWAQGFRDLFWANIFFGIGGGVAMAPHMAMSVQSGHRVDAMGAVMALVTMGHSMGMLAGSLLAGVMMDFFHLEQAFIFGTFSMIAGIFVFMACTGHGKK